MVLLAIIALVGTASAENVVILTLSGSIITRRCNSIQACVDGAVSFCATSSSACHATCNIRGGTHAGKVVIPPGTAKALIHHSRFVNFRNTDTFEPVQASHAHTTAGPHHITIDGSSDGGSAILSGTVTLPSTGWTRYTGNIWRRSLPPEFLSEHGNRIQQLFVDGDHSFEARYPNANLTTVGQASSWASTHNSTSPSNVSAGWIYDPGLADGKNYTGESGLFYTHSVV